ncbi:MAG: hypothetical protein ACXVXP_00730 [Mycobacteriaceae bacterium]
MTTSVTEGFVHARRWGQLLASLAKASGRPRILGGRTRASEDLPETHGAPPVSHAWLHAKRVYVADVLMLAQRTQTHGF